MESPEPAELPRLLRDALRAIEGDLVAALAAAGYEGLRPGHWTVFRHLDPQGMRMADLARDARVSRQAIAQLVAELEQLGYLQRRPDPEDGRAQIVSYTPRGREGFQVAERQFATIAARPAELVGERALKTTLRVLAEIGKPA